MLSHAFHAALGLQHVLSSILVNFYMLDNRFMPAQEDVSEGRLFWYLYFLGSAWYLYFLGSAG